MLVAEWKTKKGIRLIFVNRNEEAIYGASSSFIRVIRRNDALKRAGSHIGNETRLSFDAEFDKSSRELILRG